MKRLTDKGVKVAIGQAAVNVDGAVVVVVSSAIKRDNPELVAARAKRLPVVRRAEMLAELMRLKSCVAIAGTHGKTTTTSMVAALLDAGQFDPTVINGGIINAYGTNARVGAGDWMVVEADESDGTFLKLPADVAIVTNVDPEHLDHFKTFDAVKEAFRTFVENVPFYGFAVMCTDHPAVQQLVGRIEDRRIVTYGENPQADARLVGMRHATADRISRFSSAIAPAQSFIRSRICSCRCRAFTMRSTQPPPSQSLMNSASAMIGSGRRWRLSAASAGASPAPGSGTGSPLSTITVTIRWRLRPCSRQRVNRPRVRLLP